MGRFHLLEKGFKSQLPDKKRTCGLMRKSGSGLKNGEGKQRSVLQSDRFILSRLGLDINTNGFTRYECSMSICTKEKESEAPPNPGNESPAPKDRSDHLGLIFRGRNLEESGSWIFNPVWEIYVSAF